MLKNHCQTHDNKIILLYFLLEAKKCFTFKLIMSNFQLLSWKVYLYVYILFFFINSPIIPVPFVEKNILSPLNYLCSFEKYYLTIFVLMYLWIFILFHLNYVSILSPISFCVVYCGFIVNFEVELSESFEFPCLL